MYSPGAQVSKCVHLAAKCAHRVQGEPLILNTDKFSKPCTILKVNNVLQTFIYTGKTLPYCFSLFLQLDMTDLILSVHYDIYTIVHHMLVIFNKYIR